jgi:superfamily II DNA or RNA helicase
MLEKYILLKEIGFVCYTNQHVPVKYLIEGKLPQKEIEISGLDAPLEVPSIPLGCTLTVKTAKDIFIKGNCDGYLFSLNEGDQQYNVKIYGNISETAEIHAYGASSFYVQGYMTGKVVTPCPITVDSDVTSTAKMKHDASGIETPQLCGNFYNGKSSYKDNNSHEKYSQISSYFIELGRKELPPDTNYQQLANKLASSETSFKQLPKKHLASEMDNPDLQTAPKKKTKIASKKHDDELAGLDENELDTYIKGNELIAYEKALSNFEQERKRIRNHVANFVADIDQNGFIPAEYGAKSLQLKKHQMQALIAFSNALQQNFASGYFDCATGIGKTIIMIALYLAMGQPRTLVLESRSNLIAQTRKKFKEFVYNCDVGVFDGKHKVLGKNITISTYQSLQAQNNHGQDNVLWPGNYELVICDEGHNALGKGRHMPIAKFLQTAFVIGCSATSEYNTVRQRGSLHSMADLFGKLIYRYALPDAIKDHVLSPCLNVKVAVETSIDLKAIRCKSNDDYNQQALAKQLDHKKINQIPALLYANGFNQLTGERILGKTTIVFAIGVNNAKQIATEFNNLLENHSLFKHSQEPVAVAIYGSQSSEERKKIIKKHSTGEIKVLVCDMLCTEGYDNANVEVIMNFGPTLSSVKEAQRSGRATRLSPILPNKVALVIDFVYPQLQQITFDTFLDGKEICGEQYVKTEINPKNESEILTSYEVEPFTILGNHFSVLGLAAKQNIQQPSALPPKSIYDELEEILFSADAPSQPVPQTTKLLMFQSQTKRPVAMFKQPIRPNPDTVFDIEHQFCLM